MRFLYTLVFYFTLPLIVLRLLWRSRRSPLYRQRLSERFGFFPIKHQSVPSSPVIWLHTVSVGETISARPVVLGLLEQHPQHHLVITTTTPTGSQQVYRLFQSQLDAGRISHAYIPYDLPFCIERFLTRVKPQLCIFMETEVWPNIIEECQQKQIPTVLINGRLSEKSLKGYQRFLSLSQAVFSSFSKIIAQTKEDAERFSLLAKSHIDVSGSLKSEISIPNSLQKEARELKQQWSNNGMKKIIIAASTHEGEDEIILSAFSALLKKNQQLVLVLVPRHVERFEDVKKMCRAYKFFCSSRSDVSTFSDDTQVLVGDTMGELMLLYGVSDIAIVGGSFVERGGHNMLEPAAWGLPIISGASVFNFAGIAKEMSAQDALVLVDDQQSLIEAVSSLLDDEQRSATIGNNAEKYILASKGALKKTLSIIDDVVSLPH